MTAWIISIARIVIGAAGVWLGFYYLPDIKASLNIVCLLSAGFVGLISFLSHVVFYKSDAKRLGFSGGNTAFQWEVGFANMAFGLTALLAYFGSWGLTAEIPIVLGYALYLLQAAILHTYNSFRKEKTYKGHLIFSVIGTALIVILLLYFSVTAMQSVKMFPF
jgi:hypothetical protein